jgi:uncharacterized protein (DUF736 family)
MTAVLGFVTRSETGAFKGHLRTLNIRADIDVVPVRDKTSAAYPDYRVTCAGVEVGAGWSGVSPITRQALCRPEPVPSRRWSARLQGPSGRAAGQDDDDVFALIWHG